MMYKFDDQRRNPVVVSFFPLTALNQGRVGKAPASLLTAGRKNPSLSTYCWANYGWANELIATCSVDGNASGKPVTIGTAADEQHWVCARARRDASKCVPDRKVSVRRQLHSLGSEFRVRLPITKQ